jgi:hypothetical protein
MAMAAWLNGQVPHRRDGEEWTVPRWRHLLTFLIILTVGVMIVFGDVVGGWHVTKWFIVGMVLVSASGLLNLVNMKLRVESP